MNKYVRLIMGVCLGSTFASIAWSQSSQNCDPTQTVKHSCLNASGATVGSVGPFPIANIEGQGCLANLGNNQKVICTQISAMCNSTFPNLCNGKCTAGDSTGGALTCKGVLLMPGGQMPGPPKMIIPGAPTSRLN